MSQDGSGLLIQSLGMGPENLFNVSGWVRGID